MRLISNKALRDFAAVHPDSDAPLQAWRRLVEHNAFGNFSDLKRVFNSVDKVSNYYVFNIAGNSYRLIAAIHFTTQTLYVRSVLTHRDYDKWRP